MEMVARIIAYYIFLLALLPCSDGGFGVVEVARHMAGVEHTHEKSHTKHTNNCSDDTCPPFCICNCCSTAIDHPVVILFIPKAYPPAPQKAPSFVPNFMLSEFDNSFWQPPRFS